METHNLPTQEKNKIEEIAEHRCMVCVCVRRVKGLSEDRGTGERRVNG